MIFLWNIVSNVLLLPEFVHRKRQQVANVTNVAIRSDTVSSIELNAGDVISHLQEIDLQDNLLWNWTEVSAVFDCFYIRMIT